MCFVLKVWAEPRLAEPWVSCVPGSHSANEPHPQIVTFNIIYIVCIDICGQRSACGGQFSSSTMSPGTKSKQLSFGGKHIYLLSHVTSPNLHSTSCLEARNVAHIVESLPEAFSPVLQEFKSDLTVEEADSWLAQISCFCVPETTGPSRGKSTPL